MKLRYTGTVINMLVKLSERCELSILSILFTVFKETITWIAHGWTACSGMRCFSTFTDYSKEYLVVGDAIE